MPKSKQPPPRKPVKAKGALPAPVTAPERVEVVWYKQRKNQAIIAVVLLLVLAFAVKTGIDLAERADVRDRQVRALEQFERRVQLLNSELPETFQQISASPGAYLAGSLSQEEFQQQTDAWVETLRDYHQGLNNTEVPEDMPALKEAQGLYAQSSLIFVDAAKTFGLAPSIDDPQRREDTLVLARNEFLHGSAVLAMAERRFVDARNILGLNDPEAVLPQVQFPEEEQPIPPPADEPGAEVSPLPVESPLPAEPPAADETPQQLGPEPAPTDAIEESPEPQPSS